MITIDAQNKKLGRLASEVAKLLRGKDAPDFAPNITPERQVKVTNLSKLAVDPRKLKGKAAKVYTRYSGYPGGLKHETLGEVVAKKGYSEAFRRAVYGMLPDNKLRPRMMKNLILEE